MTFLLLVQSTTFLTHPHGETWSGSIVLRRTNNHLVAFVFLNLGFYFFSFFIINNQSLIDAFPELCPRLVKIHSQLLKLSIYLLVNNFNGPVSLGLIAISCKFVAFKFELN